MTRAHGAPGAGGGLGAGGRGGGGAGRGGKGEATQTETFSSFYQQPCEEYCSAWHKSSPEIAAAARGCQPPPEITSARRHWCLCGPVSVPIVPEPIAWGILFPAFVSPAHFCLPSLTPHPRSLRAGRRLLCLALAARALVPGRRRPCPRPASRLTPARREPHTMRSAIPPLPRRHRDIPEVGQAREGGTGRCPVLVGTGGEVWATPASEGGGDAGEGPGLLLDLYFLNRS